MAISLAEPRLAPLAAWLHPFGDARGLPPSMETLPEEYEVDGTAVKGRRLRRSDSWAGYDPCRLSECDTDPFSELAVQRWNPGSLQDKEPSPGDDAGVTTFMLKNLPRSLTQVGFEEALEECGFGGEFDYIYMPMDFKTRRNMRFAFVNFRSARVAARFARSPPPTGWDAAAWQVAVAKVQGTAANSAVHSAKSSRVRNRKYHPRVIQAHVA